MNQPVAALTIARRPIPRWMWGVSLLLTLLAVFTVLFGPFLWRQAIIRRLQTLGVEFSFSSLRSSETGFTRSVRYIPGMGNYHKGWSARVTIDGPAGVQSEHLSEIRQGFESLDYAPNVHITNSNDLHQDLARLRSPYIHGLAISGHAVSAADVRLLQGMPNLRVLDLSGCQLDRSAFQELGVLNSLQQLLLDQTALQDDDLRLLAKLTHLQFLSLSNTDVSEAATERLRLSLPNLETTDD